MKRTVLLLASLGLGVLLVSGVSLAVRTEPAQAAFPGTNGRIAFGELGNNNVSNYRNWSIRLITPAGAGPTTLLDRGDNQLHPAVSPKGTRVAFSRLDRPWSQRGDAEIYKINVDNRQITQITRNETEDIDPTWSPDGSRVAFQGRRTVGGVTNTDIFVRSSDGKGTTINLTQTPNQYEYAPAWSPDGEEVAFNTYEDVFVLNLQTGQTRNLTADGEARLDSRPNWSPGGRRIVFVSEAVDSQNDSNTFSTIYTMDASDGSDRRQLAQTSFENNLPAGATLSSGATYSPNGRQIAYVRTEVDYVRAAPELITMNASDGSNKRTIHSIRESEDSYIVDPDWGVAVQR